MLVCSVSNKTKLSLFKELNIADRKSTTLICVAYFSSSGSESAILQKHLPHSTNTPMQYQHSSFKSITEIILDSYRHDWKQMWLLVPKAGFHFILHSLNLLFIYCLPNMILVSFHSSTTLTGISRLLINKCYCLYLILHIFLLL